MPAVELVQEARDRLVGAQVDARRLADRRAVEPVRRTKHPGREPANGGDRLLGVAQVGERRQRRAAQLLRLLDDALRILDRAAAEAPFEEVDRAPLDA